MPQAKSPVEPHRTWMLVLPDGADMIVVLNDAGETPVFDDADAARRVGLAEQLERCQALPVPQSAGLVSPTPYHPGMAFDAARAESRALLTARGRRRLRGQ